MARPEGNADFDAAELYAANVQSAATKLSQVAWGVTYAVRAVLCAQGDEEQRRALEELEETMTLARVATAEAMAWKL